MAIDKIMVHKGFTTSNYSEEWGQVVPPSTSRLRRARTLVYCTARYLYFMCGSVVSVRAEKFEMTETGLLTAARVAFDIQTVLSGLMRRTLEADGPATYVEAHVDGRQYCAPMSTLVRRSFPT